MALAATTKQETVFLHVKGEQMALKLHTQKTTSQHICAAAVRLCLVLNGPYKHIAVCLVDKPGRVLSKAVLPQFSAEAVVVSRLGGEGGRHNGFFLTDGQKINR